LVGSTVVSTQLSPHCDDGGAQVAVHPVAPQYGVAPVQTVPHARQLFGSLMLTQAPLQLWKPDGQPQTPF
jgi:hypothetical protein